MSLFKRQSKVKFEGGGLVLFQEVQQAISAEKALKAAGYQVRLVAPPPELRKGCDLAVEINLVEQPGIRRLFEQKDVAYISIDPLKVDTSELLQIVSTTDYGDWLMVKAGNMKLTFDKKTGVIVNISGGGCPDIPYMHVKLMDKELEDAPRPKEIGFTLCSLMLDRALEEARALWKGGNAS
jgi:hypothetical protein